MIPYQDQIVPFVMGVLATLAFQLWLRIQRRKSAMVAISRNMLALQSRAEASGHTWNPGWGGVCSGCRKDLTLPGVAASRCEPVGDEA